MVPRILSWETKAITFPYQEERASKGNGEAGTFARGQSGEWTVQRCAIVGKALGEDVGDSL